MIADLKPYFIYKDAALPWLSEVPKHWSIRRAKTVFDKVDQCSTTGNEELLTVSSARGIIRRSNANVTMFKAESYIGYKLCWPGDLVINSLWAWSGGLGVSRYHGIISSAYGIYRPRPQYSRCANYFHWFLRSAPFQWELQVRSKGIWISRLQLTDESFLDAPALIPPHEDQAAIVRFLEHANVRIDKVIHSKKKLIALLEEQRQVVIHRAVTRGLDAHIPLRKTGVVDIGEVPVSWEIVRVGSATSLIQTGPFGSQLHAEEYVTNGIPVINPSHLVDGRLSPDFRVSVSDSKSHEVMRHRLRPGDVVVARRGELGRCAVVDATQEGWICGTGSLLIRCKPSVFMPEYFQLAFSSPENKRALRLASVGATMDNLNANMAAQLRLLCPGLKEQAAIVQFVASESCKAQKRIRVVQSEIELLREYRARLIADVVTGKLDVRAVAARLPTVVESKAVPVDASDEDGWNLVNDDEVLEETMA